MKLLIFIAGPVGWKEWILFVLLIALAIVWVRTLIEIAQDSFNYRSEKLLWFLIVLFTGVIGILIYRSWGRQQKVTLGKRH